MMTIQILYDIIYLQDLRNPLLIFMQREFDVLPITINSHTTLERVTNNYYNLR